MTAAWLLSWWNLIFIVPFGLAVVYLGLYTMTGIDGDAGSHADSDAAADADAHLDADAEVHADADAHLDADAHIEAGHDLHHVEHAGTHGHGHGHSHYPAVHKAVPLHTAILAFIGVGRAPVGLVLMILLMTWGCIGFIANNVARPLVPADWMVALGSLPLAALGSVLVTSGIARLVGRYLPSTETSAHKRRDLCGLVGEALYPITPQFGMAVVRDRHGNRFQVACRAGGTANDEATIAKGEPVLLVRFDEADQTFTVIPYELGREPSAIARTDTGRTTNSERLTVETSLATDAPPPRHATREPNARESS